MQRVCGAAVQNLTPTRSLEAETVHGATADGKYPES